MWWQIAVILLIDAIVFGLIGFLCGYFSGKVVDIRITNRRIRNANNKRRNKKENRGTKKKSKASNA